MCKLLHTSDHRYFDGNNKGPLFGKSAARPLLASQEENERLREDHTNPFAQPERTGVVRVSPVQGFRRGWHDFSFSRGCVPLPLNLTGGSGCPDFGRDLRSPAPLFLFALLPKGGPDGTSLAALGSNEQIFGVNEQVRGQGLSD
jgi:hypothetical protein